MKKTTKIISLLLAVILLVGTFTGCGKNKEENTGDEFVYIANYVDFPFEVDFVNSSITVGDRIYFSYQEIIDTIVHTENIIGADYPVAEEEAIKYDTVADAVVEEPAPALPEEEDVFEQYPEEAYTWEEEIYGYKVCGMKIDGTEPVEFDFILRSDDSEEGTYKNVEGLYDVGNGNIGVLINESSDIYDLPEDFDENFDSKWDYYSGNKTVRTLKIFDESGKPVEEREIYSGSSEDEFHPWYFAFDTKGNIYLSDYQSIVIKDASGKEVKKIENANVEYLGRVSGERIGYIGWDENSYKLRIIDTDTFEAGEPITLPNDCYDVRAYSDEYIVVYNGNNSLFGVKENGEKEKIINWLDVDLSSENVSTFSVLKNGDVFCFYNDWNNDSGKNNFDVIHFVKTPAKDVKQKTVITLAANYLDWNARSLILEFNKTNPDYRIKVMDYSEYETGDDYNAGITKLNTEIIAGKVPDIICTENIPVKRYVGKGLIEDLTPYIEKSLGMSGLVEPFMNAVKTDDGKIFEIYSGFSFQTYMGLKKVVGEGYSWTFEDLKEALAKLPEGASVFENYYDKTSVLSDFVSRNIDSFVDWDKGTCNFDSPEFSELLEFANTFPLEIDWDNYDYEEYGNTDTNIKNGKQLLKGVYMYDFDNWRQNFYIYGDNISFIGMPSSSGNGSNFASTGVGFAMSSTCKYKDVVWEFISKILSYEYQTRDCDFENGYYYSFGFPTNKEAFDLMANYSMTPVFDEYYDPSGSGTIYRATPALGYDVDLPAEWNDVNMPVPEEAGNEEEKQNTVTYREGLVNEKGWHESPKSWVWLENESVPVYSMTEEEYGILMEMFNNCGSMYRYDTDIFNIIDEEAQGYFQGQKTLEDTVKMIQSRVKLYVNEQK